MSAKKHTPARRRRAASPKRSSAYTRLIQQRQTEIPRLTAALLASAQAGDRQAQQALQLLAGASLRATLELTAGMNVEAILHLLGLFRESLADFEEQWRSQPRFYQTWAGINDAWPCLLPRRNPDWEELKQFLFDQLQLGAAHPLNLCGKSADKKALCSQVAIYIYHALENCAWLPPSGDDPGVIRACLQPFSRTTAPQWWKVAKLIFIQLALERQPHFQKQFQTPGDTPGKVRDKIKKLVKQSFLRLAPK